MLRRYDATLLGTFRGQLEIVGYNYYSEANPARYICLCECGKIVKLRHPEAVKKTNCGGGIHRREHGRVKLARSGCPCELCEAYREKERQYCLDWYKNNTDSAKARSAKWRLLNPEWTERNNREWRTKNRSKALEATRRWRRENRDSYRESYINSSNKRRALFMTNKGRWRKGLLEELYLSQEGKCYYCAEDLSQSFHLEHKLPLSRGGLHDIDNVVLACASCNLSKRTKTDIEYFTWRKENGLSQNPQSLQRYNSSEL